MGLIIKLFHLTNLMIYIYVHLIENITKSLTFNITLNGIE